MSDFGAAVNIYHHHEFGKLSVVEREGEAWSIAADVCLALGLGNVSQTLSYLDDDEKGLITNDTPGGRQSVSIVSEPGLYSLVLRSRKPEAKPFKRWVTHEVLPSIRRHGAYVTPAKVEELLGDPDTMIRLLTDLKAERQRRQALAQQIERARPAILFAQAVKASATDINVGELAKILNQNGYATGQNRLFEELHARGYLMRRGAQWVPTQRSMDLKVMRLKETVVESPGRDPIARLTTKVTGKGQGYFVELFCGQREQRGAA